MKHATQNGSRPVLKAVINKLVIEENKRTLPRVHLYVATLNKPLIELSLMDTRYRNEYDNMTEAAFHTTDEAGFPDTDD